MRNSSKNEKKLIIGISLLVIILLIIIAIIIKGLSKDIKSVKAAHEELIRDSSKYFNNISEIVPTDNSPNMETPKKIEQDADKTEYLKDAIDEMNNKTIDFSKYKHIEDLRDYSKCQNAYEIVAEEPSVIYSQQYYFTEIIHKDFNKLRLSFCWVDTKQELREYHLYNEDMSLEYMPVEENAGSIVYIIENVSEGDSFEFYLDAPYLAGVSFLQEEQEEKDRLNFETEEDILAYYGDWIYELEE